MKEKTGMASPPAAYAKYLDDFEECDEIQFTALAKKPQIESSLPDPDVAKLLSHMSNLDYGEVFDAIPSTSHDPNNCQFIREDRRSDSRNSFAYGTDKYSQNHDNSLLDGCDISLSEENAAFRAVNSNFSNSLNSYQDSRSHSKSVYDAKEKSKKNSRKVCYAFATFGDCHYGAECKFSHDRKLLRREKSVDKLFINEEDRIPFCKDNVAVEDSDATCRQLEERLLELQRELNMLEEESRKPKSSVVVPKKSKTTFSSLPNTFRPKLNASFNVGGDFIVRVGNSGRTVEENVRRDPSVDRFDGSVRGRQDSPVSIESRKRRNDLPRKRKFKRSLRERSVSLSPLAKATFETVEDGFQDISDDEQSSGRVTPKAYADLDTLKTDRVTSSEEEGNTSPKNSLAESESISDLMSTASEAGLLSLSEDELLPAADLVSDSEVSTSVSQKEENVEPIDFSTVIDPKTLVDVSDDDTDETILKSSASRQSFCEAASIQFISGGCPMVYSKLPEDMVIELKKNGVNGKNHHGRDAISVNSDDLVGGVELGNLSDALSFETNGIDERQMNSPKTLAKEAKEPFLRDLRRRAGTLENHIDSKLVALNKLASGKYESLVVDKPTVNSKQSVFDSLSSELEGMIAKLTQINDQMNEHVERNQSAINNGWATNPALKHTLRRHREILRDYCTEFHRAHDNIGSQIQRESLMSGGTNEASVLNNRLKPSDMYMKEHEHIGSCDRLLDEQISIAINTREHVNTQRLSLRGISKKMQILAKKYPLINGVMQKIQMKKRKDTVVMALVISGCLILTFLYIMHS